MKIKYQVLTIFILLFFFSLDLQAQSGDGIKLFTVKSQSIAEKNSNTSNNRNYIELNSAVLNSNALQKGDLVKFELESLAARLGIQKKNSFYNNTHSIIAKSLGSENVHLTMSVHGAKARGKIHDVDTGQIYLIGYDKVSGENYIENVGSKNLDIFGCGVNGVLHTENIKEVENNEHRFNKKFSTNLNTSSTSQVDYMVVYTQSALDWINNEGTSLNLVISESFNNSVLALDNSNINVNLNLVKTHKTDFDESGKSAGEILRYLTRSSINKYWEDKYAGYMEEVHNLRYESGADIVALFAKMDDVGGVAWRLGSESGRPELGFSVNRVQQMDFTYTLIHEIGHNFGNHHSRNQDNNAAPASGGIFEYSTGWRLDDNGDHYATVMTYNEDDPGIPYFSNPNVSYSGVPTGSYNGIHAPADNTRSMNEMKSVIADYSENQVVIDINPGQVAFEAQDTFEEININAFTDWEIIYPQDYFAFIANSSNQQVFSGSGNMQLNVITSDNPDTDSREQVITIRTTDGAQEVKLNVKQEGANAPAAPNLVSPSDGAVEQSLTPKLDWDPVSKADNYQVQVSTNSSFSNIVINKMKSDTEHNVDSGVLSYSTRYYWRVRAIRSGINGQWSSDNRDFTTKQEPLDPPSTPSLSSPDDGATGISRTPTLKWSSVSGADEYEVQVDTDPGVNSPFIDEPESNDSYSIKAGELDYSTTYYWQVRARNDGGPSGWSDIWKFTTKDKPEAEITVPSTPLSFGDQQVGTVSSPQSYTLSGSNLSEDIEVSVPSGFEVAKSESGSYQSTPLTISASDVESGQELFVKFMPSSAGQYSDNITHNSSQVSEKKLQVKGNGVAQPTVSVTSPSQGVSWQSGTSHDIQWSTQNVSGQVDIELHNSSGKVETLFSATDNDGSENWSIDSNRPSGTDYEINIFATDDRSVMGSSGTFEITSQPTPEITLSKTSISFGDQSVGASSSPKSYTLSGSNLSEDIEVSVPPGFSVAKSESGSYQSTLTVSASDVESGSFFNNGETLYVKFEPSTGKDYSGNISHSSSEVKEKNLAVSGQGIEGDAKEPNDALTEAADISYGDKFEDLTIVPESDVDVFKFTGSKGDEIEIIAATQHIDGKIWLIDESEEVIAQEDDEWSKGTEILEFTLGYSGTHYIRYSYYGNGYSTSASKASNRTPASSDSMQSTSSNIYSLELISSQPPVNEPDPDITVNAIPQEISLGQSITVSSEVLNKGGDAESGGIIYSFPDMTSSAAKQYVSSNSATNIQNYVEFDKGETINTRTGQTAAKYLMVEGSESDWSSNETRTLSIDVTPQQAGTFRIYVRSAMKGKDNNWYNEPTSSTETDQQQWPVNSYTVNVIDNKPISVQYSKGWNLVSIPVDISGQNLKDFYSSGIEAGPHEFDEQYQEASSLSNSKGYWVKLDSDETVEFNGDKLQELTISLHKGWNLIGMVSDELDVPDDIQDPGNIIEDSKVWENSFDSINGTYQLIETAKMKPGHGYFIKATRSGEITLSTQ